MAALAGIIYQGRWAQDKSKDENAEEYFKMIGVSLPLRALAKRIGVTLEFSYDKDAETWTMKNINSFKTKETKFKSGEMFKDVTIDGKHTTTSITVDGTKLVFVSNGYCKHEITGIMDFYEDYMIETIRCNGVVCKRRYNKEKQQK